MKPLSQRAIERLGKHVTGDGSMTPYRSGPKLVSLFNEFGCNELYKKEGFPSRWSFAQDRIQEINGTEDLIHLIERVFDPLEFKEHSKLDPHAAANDFNDFLRRDGFEVVITPEGAKLRTITGASIVFITPPTFRPASNEFISEHIKKCEEKLRNGDFNGAITNARSLCEDVLLDLERQLDKNASQKYDGDLPKLYKRVRKLLNMDPDVYKEREDICQVVRGLTSIVDGLSSVSNELGDRHGGGSRPKPHHAYLAVNAANTLCMFILSSFAMQQTSDAERRADA